MEVDGVGLGCFVLLGMVGVMDEVVGGVEVVVVNGVGGVFLFDYGIVLGMLMIGVVLIVVLYLFLGIV